MSAASPPAPPRRGSRTWLFGMGCGALAVLATPTALLAGILLAPALAVGSLERASERGAGRPMLFCGLAASLVPMMTLWTAGGGVAAAWALAGTLPTLGLAWAAQGAAWLAAELAPLLVLLVQAARVRAHIARLRAERVRLEAEWGIPEAAPRR